MNPKYSPVYLLRAYAWNLLKINTDMDEADYNGLVPVVPLNEEPEMTEFNKPYLIYGYTLQNPGRLSEKGEGSMSFAIQSTDFGDITTIINILSAAFGRQDESARDVNNFTSTIGPFVGIRFGSIELGFAEGGSPEETEGGRMTGIVNIRFNYFVDYNVITDFGTVSLLSAADINALTTLDTP